MYSSFSSHLLYRVLSDMSNHLHFDHCASLGRLHVPAALIVLGNLNHLLLVANSSVNVLIYYCCGLRFRQGLRKMLTCRYLALHYGLIAAATTALQKNHHIFFNCRWCSCQRGCAIMCLCAVGLCGARDGGASNSKAASRRGGGGGGGGGGGSGESVVRGASPARGNFEASRLGRQDGRGGDNEEEPGFPRLSEHRV